MLINLRNALMSGKRLPYDAEVEYLESTGTQWIDTGLDYFADFEIGIKLRENVSNKSLGTSSTMCMERRNASNPIWLLRVNGSPRYSSASIVDYHVMSWKGGVFAADGVTASTISNPFASGTMTLFGAGGQTYPNMIYACKLWDANGTLVRDYIPVRKKTVGYLYDRVSGKLFGNAGTGDFVLGPDVVPVEWLQSGANTYINTGIIPDDTYGMEVTGYTTQTVDSAWIGTRYGSNGRCFMGYSPSLGFYYGWNGRQDIQYTTGVWSTASMNLYNSRKNTMDGTEVGSIAQTLGAQNRAIYLFALTANGTLGLKLKSALITKGTEDVLKLQSVRVGTEGAMMDVLTRRIYRNAGTGAFTYGNDLKYPIPAE